MSVMLCTGATFVKKNSCLVAKIVSFNNAGLHLLTFRILETYPSKNIELFFYLGEELAVTLSHINDVIILLSN